MDAAAFAKMQASSDERVDTVTGMDENVLRQKNAGKFRGAVRHNNRHGEECAATKKCSQVQRSRLTQ
jgi:hypothetical protein